MGEQAFRFEHGAVIDVLLGTAAHRVSRRPAESAGGVAEPPGIPDDLPGVGVMLFHGRGVRRERLPARGRGRGTVAGAQQEGTGHLSPLEVPGQLAGELAQFAGGLPAARNPVPP